MKNLITPHKISNYKQVDEEKEKLHLVIHILSYKEYVQ